MTPDRPKHDRRPAALLGAIVAIALIVAAAAGSPNASTASPASDALASGNPTTQRAVREAADELIAAFNTQNAQAFVAAVERDGSQRWVPWLVDLIRSRQSNLVSVEAGRVLEAITGVPAGLEVENLNAYGAWAHERSIDGGDGYRDYKAAIYARFDPAFAAMLASIPDQTQVAAIQFGGVPLGGIPELNDPERVDVADAVWMTDDEVVLGVIVDGDAVAYPLRILARHELANDTVGGERLAIVYCTLCKSAQVFERDVAGQSLSFLTSGLLLNSNKIMYDLETGSLWSHLRGVAIGGPLLDTELTVRAVNHLRWRDWIAQYPDSQVLALPAPTFFDDPERPPLAYDYSPEAAYRSYYDTPGLWFPVLDAPDTFSPKTEVLGIAHNGDAIALDIAAFNERNEVATITVGGEAFTVEPTGVSARVVDAAGGEKRTEQSFWFAWWANHPETRVWPK